MLTLPDLATPFAVEHLYDRDRAGGFVVLHRERRRILLARPDGVLLWAYLRQAHTVVRTEVLRAEAAAAVARAIVEPRRLCERLHDALTPGVPVDEALEALPEMRAARLLGSLVEEQATQRVYAVGEDGARLVVEIDREARVVSHAWHRGADRAAWLGEHDLAEASGRVMGSLGGAPLTLLVLAKERSAWLERACWHPDARIVSRPWGREELAADIARGGTELGAWLASEERDGHPVTAIVADLELGEDGSDVSLLQGLARLCARFLVLFVADASPSLLGRTALSEPRLDAARMSEAFAARSHHAFSQLRQDPESRWLALAWPRGEWGPASFVIAAQLHDAFADDGWCANLVSRHAAAGATARVGPRGARALAELGVSVARCDGASVWVDAAVSLARLDVLPVPEGEAHLNASLAGTLIGARVLSALRAATALRSDAGRDPVAFEAAAAAWLGGLVAADESPFGRGRVTATTVAGGFAVELALWLRHERGYAWVTLAGEVPHALDVTSPWATSVAPPSPPVPRLDAEPTAFLRDRVRLCLPHGAVLLPPLGCPGELWRVDMPPDASWAAAETAVARGASPELQAASFGVGDHELWVTAEACFGPVSTDAPWDLPADSPIARRLGSSVASRALGDLRLAVRSVSPSPAWLPHFARHLLANAVVGRRRPALGSVRFVVGDEQSAWMRLEPGSVARLLVEDDVRAVIVTHGAARLEVHALSEERLHLPYVAPTAGTDTSRVLAADVAWRRNVQKGRTVRDAVVPLAGRRALYLVSTVDDPEPGWEAHQRMLASLVVDRAGHEVAHEESRDWRTLYEVAERLGQGGAAEVHRVRHLGWAMDLALKRPRRDVSKTDAPLVDTIANEAEAWTKLGPHPNVVSCYQARRHGGVPHIFVELVEGGSLADWIADGRLYAAAGDASGFSSPTTHREATAFARILDVGIQVAHGLHHAHEHGLIHQDVKPANVLLTEDGVAKVTDFGLVNAVKTEHQIAIGGTVVATFGGLTPAYCSPEQATASARDKLTRRTDVWSWAVMMLEMFNGRVTWRSGALARMVLAELCEHGPSEPHAPPLPAALAELLGSCLSIAEQARPHDMLEVAAEVARIYHQTLGSRHPRRVPRPADGRADVLNNRGASLMDLARGGDAVHAWEEARRLDPMHLEAGYNLALYHHRHAGRAELAERIERLGQAHPERWEAAYARAWTHVERGDAESAHAALERAKALGAPRRELAAARAALRPGLTRLATQRIHPSEVLAMTGDVVVGLRRLPEASAPRLLLFAWHLADNHVRTVEIAMHRCQLSVSPDGASCWIAGVAVASRGGLWQGRRELCRYQLSDLSLDTRIDIESWRPLTEAREHVQSLAVTEDDVLVGLTDGRLERWNIARRVATFSQRVHPSAVTHVAVAGDRVMTCSADADEALVLEGSDLACVDVLRLPGPRAGWLGGEVALFVTETGWSRYDVVRREHHAVAVRGRRWLTDGARMLELAGTSTLRLWDLDRGTVMRELTPRAVPVLEMTHHQGTVVVLYADRTAVAFRLAPVSRAPWLVVRPRTSEQLLADEAEYGDALVGAEAALTAGDEPAAERLLRRAGEVVGYQRAPELFALRRRIATSTTRGAARGCLLRQVVSTIGWRRVCLSGQGGRALCLDERGQIALFALSSRGGAQIEDLLHPGESVSEIALSDDGRRALTLGVSRQLVSWELSEGQRTELGACRAMALSADGAHALVLRGGLAWIDLRRGREEPQALSVRGLTAMALGAGGELAVAGYRDGTVVVWAPESERVMWHREAHRGVVRSVAVAAPAVALSCADDVCVWDLEGGHERARHPWSATRLGVSGDGSLGRCALDRGAAIVWEVETGVVAHALEGADDVAVTRDATAAVTAATSGLCVWELDWERVS